jgi:16S rRNA (cytosine967-C5)-methyltransferase
MAPHSSSPRALAWRVLLPLAARPGQMAQRLDRALARSSLSRPDKALATELVMGVVRRQATLEALVRSKTRIHHSRIERGAWLLCALGAYQLVFLSRIPAYAAVNESTRLCQQLRKPRWASFVNGVLRAIARDLTEEYISEPDASAVPVSLNRYRRLHTKLFPDPRHDQAGYFAAAFSFPQWLVERWIKRMSAAELWNLGFWFNAPPVLTLRVNTLKTTRDLLLAELARQGIDASPGEHPDAVCLEHAGPVPALPGFAEGRFAVQDLSAMWAATLLAPPPGGRCLDLCSAPGGKTAQLAALMQNQGRILATDVSPQKLRLVQEACARLGVSIVSTACIGRKAHERPQGPFDAILADVPCSNTGVLAKRVEARWRLRPSDLQDLPRLQRTLLALAAGCLSPCGRLVYSTCSIEPEENEQVVAAVLRENARLRLVEERRHWPGAPSDGGYQALLVAEPALPGLFG